MDRRYHRRTVQYRMGHALRALAWIVGLAILPNALAHAQPYPSKPIRLIGLSPSDVVVFISLRPPYTLDLEQVETERLDLRNDAEQCSAVVEQPGQHGVAARALGNHRRKGREGGRSKAALDPDRIQAQRRGHATMVRPHAVKRHRLNPVIARTPARASVRLPPRARSREEAQLPRASDSGGATGRVEL